MGAVAGLLALLWTATACGDRGVSVGSGSGRPTGADQVVVQVVVAGGFVPVEAALQAVPTVTVLGDGTTITAAPVLAIYPGPALQPLQSVKLSAAQVDALADRAGKLGLLVDGLDFGTPPVADAPSTTVTITTGGRTYRHTADALGSSDDVPTVGLTPLQVENRRKLSQFVQSTNELPPGRQAWEPSSIAVYVVGPYTPEPELPQPPATWPLARAPSTTGTRPCTLVTGDDTQALVAALSRANARTPWVIAGATWSVAFRPVVPGQAGCE